MARMWMVRGEGGSLYEAFRERGLAAIGWAEIAGLVKPGMPRKEIIEIYLEKRPDRSLASAIAGAGQVWRFLNDMAVGDEVVTYSPHNRTYLVGKIQGPAAYHAETADQGMALARTVHWEEIQVERD